MSAEHLKKAHRQLITEGRRTLRHRIQGFKAHAKEDQDEQALQNHAEIVEMSAVALENVSLTKHFSYERDEKAQTQTVSGRIRADVITVTTKDSNEGRNYSGVINDAKVTRDCARILWEHYGAPTRRRHISAGLMESKT